MADTEELDNLDNEDTLDDDLQESAGGNTDDAPSEEAAASGDAESKRLKDLMSNWQKEQARNAKLEAELKSLKTKNPTNESIASPVATEFMDFARESARNSLYASDPRFAKYKIPVSAISGDTPAAMQESVKEQRALLDSLETQIRRDVMVEHGIDAEVTSGRGVESLGIANMSDDDFAKLVAKRSRF